MHIRLITKSDPFEKRVYEIINLLMALITTYLFVQSIVIESRPITQIILGLIPVFSLSSYILSRRGFFKDAMSFLTMVMLYGIAIFFWFWISGINGSTGITLVSVIALSYILIPGKYRHILVVFNAALLISLVLVHYLKPEMFAYGQLSYSTMPLEYMMIAFAHIVYVYYLKKEFDSEQKKVGNQNTQLVDLNRNLSRTVEEQLQTLRRLSHTQDKLVESEKMASLGHLTAGLAHEINNPLNYLGGVVHPLRVNIKDLESMIPDHRQEEASHLSEEINILLKDLENGTQMASGIIKRLQNVSRDSEKLVPINISELIKNVVSLVKKSADDIEFQLDLEETVLVNGNALELNQVLINLLRNAIQAISAQNIGTEGEGFIKITSRIKESQVEIYISDNGEGMDAGTINRAFDAFYTTKDEKGTGLGLFIASGIIEKHRGQIQIQSDQNIGTTFTITLPLL